MSSEKTTESPLLTSRLGVTEELTLVDFGDVRFADFVLDRGIAHTWADNWPTTVESLDDVLPYAFATSRWRSGMSALLDLAPLFGEECVAGVELRRGKLWANAAAHEHALLEDVEAWLRDGFPREERDPLEIAVSFWSSTGSNRSSSRRLTVPAWTDIRDNYPGAVQAAVGRLLECRFDADAGARLVLWHGPPGTGKTYAIRALAWEWREWCELHFVTDPDEFFGGRTGYMLDVLLDEDGDGDEWWRLLVLEDTGELLTADAKERSGQGLSRLLNVVDGLIGQGLRVLVLVTTNEPLTRLHPAVGRPGRAAATIEFGAFTAEEAAVWLRKRGCGAEPRHATLAELYALAEGRPVEAKRKVGF